MKKEIKGFENYTVNDCGDNEKTIYNEIRGKYKKPQQYKNGYFFVSLFQNGKNKIFLLHRLIAEAFIPNPDNKPCIDHINGDKTDNRVENLRWCTQKENMNNPITKKRISENRIGMKFSELHKEHLREKAKTKIGNFNNFYGKKHSEETKKKMSESHRKKWG